MIKGPNNLRSFDSLFRTRDPITNEQPWIIHKIVNIIKTNSYSKKENVIVMSRIHPFFLFILCFKLDLIIMI